MVIFLMEEAFVHNVRLNTRAVLIVQIVVVKDVFLHFILIMEHALAAENTIKDVKHAIDLVAFLAKMCTLLLTEHALTAE